MFRTDAGLRTVMRDHGSNGLLRTRRRDSQYREHRQCPFNLRTAGKEIPGIPFIFQTSRHSLSGIDHRTAAHGDHRTNALIAHPVNRVADKSHPGIRLHAAHFNHGKARFLQTVLHCLQNAGAVGRSAAKKHQHLARTPQDGGHHAADFMFGAAAENEVGGIGIGEVEHLEP